jgi:hypothetical protein
MLKLHNVREAAAMTRDRFTRQGWEMSAMAHGAATFLADIRSPADAEHLGVDWPGFAYTLREGEARGPFDLGFFLLGWLGDLRWILSGEMAADMCREADEDMLANAY